MRPRPRSTRLLVVVALATLPIGCTCYGRYGSLGDYAADSGGSGDTGGHDDGATNDDGGTDDVGTGSTGTDGTGGTGGTDGTGGNGPSCGVVRLADIAAGIGGFAMDGEGSWCMAGQSASGAGDVNGDGRADVLVGAPSTYQNGALSGRAYLVLGKASTDRMSLADVAEGIGGFSLDGGVDHEDSGHVVSGAGDVNGDGTPDLIVAAPWADADAVDDCGRTYVVFAKSDSASLALADVARGDGGFVLDGEANLDLSGWSASGAGDVNGDGLADVVVGAPYADPNGTYSGRTYVVFGKTDTGRVALADVALESGGFAMDGEAAGDHSGWSVSGAGDVNGDGRADLVVGAKLASPNGTNSGRTYVVFGRGDTDKVQLADVAAGIGGFAVDGEAEHDGSGRSVSGVGDVDGDGLDDVVIGARHAGPEGASSGRAYLVFGKAGTNMVSLADVAQGVGGFAIDGEAGHEHAGLFVSRAGDISGDGRPDVLVGALWDGPHDLSSGRAYVVFGKADTDRVSLSDVAQGIGGFVLEGESEGELVGRSVGGAGDVNGDGVPDIVAGAPGAAPNGEYSGRAYVIFGGDFSCAGR